MHDASREVLNEGHAANPAALIGAQLGKSMKSSQALRGNGTMLVGDGAIFDLAFAGVIGMSQKQMPRACWWQTTVAVI